MSVVNANEVTSRFTVEGSRVLYHVPGGDPAWMPQSATTELVPRLAEMPAQHAQDVIPVMHDWANAVLANRRISATANGLEAQLEDYKHRVRTALVEAWENHRSHISRQELNDFLEALGLPRTERRVTGRVRVVMEAWVDVETVSDFANDDEEALREAACDVDTSDLQLETVDAGDWDVEDIEEVE